MLAPWLSWAPSMTLQEFQHLVIGTHPGPTGAGPQKKNQNVFFNMGGGWGVFFGCWNKWRDFESWDHCSPHWVLVTLHQEMSCLMEVLNTDSDFCLYEKFLPSQYVVLYSILLRFVRLKTETDQHSKNLGKELFSGWMDGCLTTCRLVFFACSFNNV